MEKKSGEKKEKELDVPQRCNIKGTNSNCDHTKEQKHSKINLSKL